MKNRTAFFAAIRTEFRLIKADTASKLVLFLTVAMMIYSLLCGIQFSRQRTASAAAMMASTTEKWLMNRTHAQAIAEGREEIPDRPYRDPGNTIYVGSSLAGLAELPQAPLSFLSVGESDLNPAAINVSAKGKENFLFDDEISNPTGLLSGVFDPAFVIAILLPLFIMALTYNIVSSERELGTLPLNASAPVPLRIIMIAKLLVRTAIPLLAIGGILLGTTLVIHPVSFPAMMIFTVVVVVYGLFWGIAALTVNALGFDSTGNALVTSILWIVTVFIVPALIDAVVELVYPSLPRTAMVLEVRNATVDADTQHNAAQAQYELDHTGTGVKLPPPEAVACFVGQAEPAPKQEEQICSYLPSYSTGGASGFHVQTTGSVDISSPKCQYVMTDGDSAHGDSVTIRGSVQDKNLQRLRSTILGRTVGDSMYAIQQRRLRQRKALADKLAFLSPVMIMQDIAAEKAGNGSIRYASYFSQIDRYHDAWRTFFISRAEHGMRLDSAEYDKFPKFEFKDSAVNESHRKIAIEAGILSVYLLIAAGSARLLFNRFRIAG